MRRIALTGGIATGKSYVARRLSAAGVPLVDADLLARDAVAAGSPGLAAVAARFGGDLVTGEGTLDRRRLGQIVFGDAAARRDLEAIVHPFVRRAIAAFFDQLPPSTPFAVADIPLLYESGRQREFDAVVVAACRPETQLARLIARDGLPEADARQRIAAQLPIDAKVALADYVIRTDGQVEDTDAQVAQLIDELRRA